MIAIPMTLAAIAAFGAYSAPTVEFAYNEMAEEEAAEDILSEEVAPDHDADDENEYPCHVSDFVYWFADGIKEEDSERKHGDVFVSADEGNVGDMVTAIVSANPTFEASGSVIKMLKYSVMEFTVNGIAVDEIASGKYEFALCEGMNRIEVVFSGTKVVEMADLSAINWKSVFTLDNLLKIISWGVMAIFSSGFFITLIRSKKFQSKTTKEIAEALEKVANSTIAESFSEFLGNTLKPILEQNNIKVDETAAISESLLKCFILSQEGTPEAKLKITEELMSLKQTDKDLAAKVQSMIEQAISDQNAKKEAQAKAIEDLKESNEAIKEQSDSEYGQL